MNLRSANALTVDWYVEFADVMRDGGFDVVLGNPPYVEYKRENAGYELPRDLKTVGCGNLHAFVTERSTALLRRDGGFPGGRGESKTWSGGSSREDTSARQGNAERLARIVVSDIVLYNPDRHQAAMESGEFLEEFKVELDEGRRLLLGRFPEVPEVEAAYSTAVECWLKERRQAPVA